MRIRSALLTLSVVGCCVLSLLPVGSTRSSGNASAAPVPRSTGIFGYSGNPAHNSGQVCTRCHTGGAVPSVAMDGPLLVKAGQTYSYQLAVSGGQRKAAGLGVSVTDGQLIATGNTRTDGDADEITHLTPELVDAFGHATFDFNWTAPATPGAVTMYGAGNSVNLNNSTAGDNAAADVLNIVVSDCMVEFTPFGNGTPGSGGLRPTLSGTNGLCSGGAVLDIDQGRGGSFFLLWVGDTQASIPFAGGTIYVDPTTTLFLSIEFTLGGAAGVPGAGSLSLTFGNVSNLAGLSLTAQALVLDPAAQKKIALSNGLTIDIGL